MARYGYGNDSIEISVDLGEVVEQICQNRNTEELIELLGLDLSDLTNHVMDKIDDMDRFLETYIDTQDLRDFVNDHDIMGEEADEDVVARLKAKYTALEISQMFGLQFKVEYAPAIDPILYPIARD